MDFNVELRDDPEHVIGLIRSSFNSLGLGIKADMADIRTASLQLADQQFGSSTAMSVSSMSPRLLLASRLEPGKRARSTSLEPQTQTLTFTLSTAPESLGEAIASNKRARIMAPESEGQPHGGPTAMVFYDKNAPTHLQNNWPTTQSSYFRISSG